MFANGFVYVLMMVLCTYPRFLRTSIYHEYTRAISAVRRLLPKSHPRTKKHTKLQKKIAEGFVYNMYS